MAAYDITQIYSLEHDTGNGLYNSLVKIDDTHYILAYTSGSSYGYLVTFSIDASYKITEIHSLRHNTSGTFFNSLVQIDSTHFMLACQNMVSSSRVGVIKTFSIDGSYNITEIASLTHDGTDLRGYYNSLVKINDTHYVLAYAKYSNGGYIKTFSIDGSYNITEINNKQYDSSTEIESNSLVKIDDTHYILAYTDYIKVFSIDGSYAISILKSLILPSSEVSLVNIDNTHFALACDRNIKILSIDGSYNITEISSLTHDASAGTYPSLVKINDMHFVLAYSGYDYDGFIKTFSIDGSYNITEIYSLEHDTGNGTDNSLVKIDDTHFMLAYTGSGSDGFIKTFYIEIPIVGPANLKSYNTNLKANIKTINTNPLANIKSLNTNV